MTAARLRLIFFILQMADILTTLIAFRMGAFEMNPMLAWMLQGLGPLLGLLVAKAMTILIVLQLQSAKLINLGNVAYVSVVAWNVWVIWSLAHGQQEGVL
jgi:hypothetical protein